MHRIDEEGLKKRILALYNPNPITATAVKNGDLVKIKDEDLDWLRDYFNEHYQGQKIKMFKRKFGISIGGIPENKKFLLYVQAIDDDEDLIQVDVYNNTTEQSIWSEVLVNISTDFKVSGRYIGYSYTIPNQLNSLFIGTAEGRELIEYFQNVPKYVLLYILDNMDIVEKRELTVQDYKRKRSGVAKKKKKKVRPKKRTVYVPKKVSISYNSGNLEEHETIISAEKLTVEESDNSKSCQSKREYCGYVPEWNSKGYVRKYTKKDGSVVEIEVRGSKKHRKPEILEKGKKKATDYILKEKENN